MYARIRVYLYTHYILCVMIIYNTILFNLYYIYIYIIYYIGSYNIVNLDYNKEYTY